MSVAASDLAVADKLAICRLIDVVGPVGMSQVRSSAGGADFLTWLGRHPRVVEDYLSSGESHEYSAVGLGVWNQLWTMFPESRDGVFLRFAEACGLTFSTPFNFGAYPRPVDPIQRFEFFSRSHRDGVLFPYFDKALTWEVRYVATCWATEDELVWVRGFIPARIKSQEEIGGAFWFVPYRLTNSKGVSVQDSENYYDHKPPTMQLVASVGGVCGAQAGFAVSTAQAFGIPAMAVGQPIHCAFIWRNRPGSWVVGNDVFGWARSTPGARIAFGSRPVFMCLTDAARSDPEAFAVSERLWWAADLFPTRPILRFALLHAAVDKVPTNLPVVRDYVALAKSRLKLDDYVEALGKVSNGLKDSPFAISDTLHGNMAGILTSLVSDARARAFVGSTLQAMADGGGGDPAKQCYCASWASAEFMTDVLRAMTHTNSDFGSPQRDGKDAGGLWDKLDGSQQMIWLRGLELVLRTGMKRKDLYEQPLNLYASLAADHATACSRALPALGAIARQALAAGVTPFGSDASSKLAELCEKFGDKAAAAEWRKTIAK